MSIQVASPAAASRRRRLLPCLFALAVANAYGDTSTPDAAAPVLLHISDVVVMTHDGVPVGGAWGSQAQSMAHNAIAALRAGSPYTIESAEGPLTLNPHRMPDGSPAILLSDLNDIATALTVMYQRQGFIATYAVVPAQQIQANGVVRIEVIEGRLGRVRTDPPDAPGAPAVRAALNGLVGKPASAAEVDSAILLARETPGVRGVNGAFQPGEQPGETGLVLNLQPGRRYAGTLAADNYGAKSTGQYRVRASAEINEPLNIGDQLDLSYIQSFDPSSPFGSVNYQAQLGDPRYVGFVSGGHNSFKVGTEAFKALNVDGTANTASTGLLWKIRRSRLLNIDSRFYVEYRDANVKAHLSYLGLPDITLVDDRTATLNAQLAVTDISEPGSVLGKALTQYSFTYRQGIDALGAKSSEMPARSTAFAILNAAWSRTQVLGRDEFLVANLSGQWTHRPVVPVEEFGVGGPGSARAYETSQVLGDRGLLAQLEYRQRAPFFADVDGFGGHKWRDLLTVKLFTDYGKVNGLDPGAALPQDQKGLADVGAGFVFGLPERFSVSLDAATRIGAYRDPNGDDDLRVFSELSYSF